MSLTHIGFEGDDADALRAFQWTKIAVAFADDWGPKILAALRAEAPVAPGAGSGRLRDALHFERRTAVGSLTMLFTDDVPYFEYVIKGTTGGQIINPIAARALHWTEGGTDVFAAQVTRGDTPANDFPARVWDRMAEEVQAGFREKVREGLAT